MAWEGHEFNRHTNSRQCYVIADQQQQQPDPFRHIADEYRQIRAGKTHAKLMDPAELPCRQQGVRRVDEGFWRQSTSSYAAPAAAKKKRKQTLERAPRKAVRIAKPGRQALRVPMLVIFQPCYTSGFVMASPGCYMAYVGLLVAIAK